MSIFAITTNNKDCKASIKWLHQLFTLDYAPDSFCVTEIIFECEIGNFDQLKLYIPFKVENLEDRCFSFFDNINKHYYSDGFEVVSDTKIIFDHKETFIPKINLDIEHFRIGSAIVITFDKPIEKNQRNGIRICFDLNKSVPYSLDGKCATSLKYLDSSDALLLGINESLPIEKLFIWLVFPTTTKNIISVIPAFWQQRLYTSVNKELMALFYGAKTDEIWSKLPRKVGMWQRGLEKPDKLLSEEKWPAIYYYCEYQIGESPEQSRPFAIMWDHVKKNPNGKFLTEKEYNVLISNKKLFTIFIDEINDEIYFNKKKIDNMQYMTKQVLIAFLKNYPSVCSYDDLMALWRKAGREVSQDNLKQQKRRIIESIPSLADNIKSVRGEGYRITGNISFCVISNL